MKLRAGSLVYATVFILIVSALCFAFYSLFFYSNQSVSAYLDLHQTQLNARSGINFLLSRQQLIKPGEKKIISLYGNGKDSVELEKNFWGALELVSASAIDKEYRYTLTALVGNQSLSDTSFALFLADQNNPLVVAGKTEITGDCYLPQGTVKTGYINGQPFSGYKPVNGTIKKSPPGTLACNEDLYKHIQSVFETARLENDSILDLSKSVLPDTLKNPFNGRTLTVYSAGIILLDHLVIEGRIRIISEKKIIVKERATLKDVLLYSPNIDFEKTWKGSVQAFASDTLLVGENCVLEYPSVLGIARCKKTGGNPLLSMGKDTKMQGDIFAFDDRKDITQHSMVRIDEKCELTGRIYSADMIDFKGLLHGSITCNRIIYANSSAVYENHLFNAVINNGMLPAWYVGSALIKQKSKNGIIKWL